MTVLLVLIPVALSLGGLGLVAFLWSLRTRQYDDLEGAAWRVLGDDDLPGGAPPRQDGSGAEGAAQPPAAG